jgi:hypothetical protein
MAMHKPRKQMRFQDGGDVNEAEMKQRGLDISNRAREEGTEKTGFFQRLREGNIDDPNSVAYKKYGAGRARLDDQIATAKEKLAGEVQEKVAANKTSDGDVSEYDRRVDAAASAPSRAPTLPARPGQGAAMAKPRMTKPAAKKEETSVESAVMAGEARRRQKSAVMNDEDRKRQNSRSAVMTDEARKRRAGKDKAFAAAQTPAAAAQEKARLGDQSIKRVTPELGLVAGVGGFGLKTLQAAAKRLAGTGAKTATKTATTGAKSPLRQKTEQLIKEDKNPGRSVSQAPASPKVSLKEKTKELIQSDRTAKTKELSSKMAEKQTPTKFTSKKSTSAAKKPVASKRTKKFNEDESGMDFKRGGSVSSRADGCAQRGKTRCKVY